MEAIFALPGACKMTFGSLLGAPGVLSGSLGALLRLMLASWRPLFEVCFGRLSETNKKNTKTMKSDDSTTFFKVFRGAWVSKNRERAVLRIGFAGCGNCQARRQSIFLIPIITPQGYRREGSHKYIEDACGGSSPPPCF